MGWWLLRLWAKILALLRLRVIFVLGSPRDEISYSFEKF